MKASTKAWIFLFCQSAVLVMTGHIMGGRQGLLWGAAIALSINGLIYFYGEWRWLPKYKSRSLEGLDPWGILAATKNLTQIARIPMPAIYVIDHKAPQAFALGRSWRQGKIFLTQGLLDHFSERELKAILAYQIACIKNLDTLAFTVTGALLDTQLTLCQGLDTLTRWLLGKRQKQDSRQNHAFSYLLAPFGALLLHLAIGRNSYYRTDQLAAELSQEPKVLAEALWKLQSYASTLPFQSSTSLAHFFIVSPLTRRGWARHFLIQPSIDQRIRKLIGHYPI